MWNLWLIKSRWWCIWACTDMKEITLPVLNKFFHIDQSASRRSIWNVGLHHRDHDWAMTQRYKNCTETHLGDGVMSAFAFRWLPLPKHLLRLPSWSWSYTDFHWCLCAETNLGDEFVSAFVAETYSGAKHPWNTEIPLSQITASLLHVGWKYRIVANKCWITSWMCGATSATTLLWWLWMVLCDQVTYGGNLHWTSAELKSVTFSLVRWCSVIWAKKPIRQAWSQVRP